MKNNQRYIWNFMPVLKNRGVISEKVLKSRLLELMHSSNVNKISSKQIRNAQIVLTVRDKLIYENIDIESDEWDKVIFLQKEIVENHLKDRSAFYGDDQVLPFDDAELMVNEGRDTFLIIKFMDEAPHIQATLMSLLSQVKVDLNRVVIVAVDNNSTDGSDEIIKSISSNIKTEARIIYVNQPIPGGGSAARYGTDRSISTIYKMCTIDNNWRRLQTARIAVTDGDTVYHHEVVGSLCDIFDNNQNVDGVMPFLTYKFTAALRFFDEYISINEKKLYEETISNTATMVNVNLSNINAQEYFPRNKRLKLLDKMELQDINGLIIHVPFTGKTIDGRNFGVLEDKNGARAFILEDRNLVLYRAPVSGFDAALIFLENNKINSSEQWKWHTVIGHDLFLLWVFQNFNFPEEIISPDSSDALKMFRCWAFAIGGQHQLSKPGFKIVTGTDYQSGRVLKSVGCLTVLGNSKAWAETEVDRLAKMIRNFSNEQSVFYGETRSRGVDRASGLYLHMTRIQQIVEEEIRSYDDQFFKDIAFPERVIFPLRWMLQNAICAYSNNDKYLKEIIEKDVFIPFFSEENMEIIKATVLNKDSLDKLYKSTFDEKQDIAEELAEELIIKFYTQIMKFYQLVVRSFLESNGISKDISDLLFKDFESCRNALKEERPQVDPTVVWQGNEYVIDHSRGQVTNMVKS